MQHDKPTLNFIQKLAQLRLGETRRASMRAELSAYADLYAAAAPAVRAVPSPFFSMRLWYSVTAFALILLVGGSGAAYASESTLPGDILYPLKIGIAEPVQSAFVTSPEGKAKLHVDFAERRLEEATQLAAQNRLDQAKQVFLAAQISKQVASSDQLASALETGGKVQASLAVRSDLEARMTAHADLLGLIAEHLATAASSTEETAHQAKTLALTVRTREKEVSQARLALENDVTATATSSLQAIAIATQKTQKSVEDLHVANGVQPTAASQAAQATIQKAAAALTDTRDQLGTDQVHAAARTAQDAARASEVASIIFKHEGLLKSIGIVATTTATTTQETSATTTESGDPARASSSPAFFRQDIFRR